MRNNGRTKLNKVLLLFTALAMVLLLSGCRTRLSNNTEVASTISDEDGWLQESYQMRRDELGMPVAKKPFITGSSDEELDGYDDYDSAMEDLDDYINNPEEDDFYDTVDGSDDDRSSDRSSQTSSSSTTRRNTNSAPPRRRTTTRRKTTPAKKNTSTKTDTSPSQEQEQQEQPKKQYTVSFDGCGVDMDGATISVEEGGKYGSLPDPPSLGDEYIFEGWFTEEKGGKKVEEGDDYTADGDQTLYAHWTQKDPAEIWGNFFDVAANDQKDKLDCQLLPDDKGKNTVEACKGNIVGPEIAPKCIIVFSTNDNVSNEEAQRIFSENSVDAEGNPTALEKVIIISDDAINGDDSQKLFYKLVLLDTMHGKIGQDTLDKAASELKVNPIWPGIYPQP